MATQVGFWDGSVAVVRLQPSISPLPNTTAAPEEEPEASAGSSPDRELQHDMVLLTHFQVDPSPLRAVAWCPPQVASPPPLPPPTPPPRTPRALPRFCRQFLLLLSTGTGDFIGLGRDSSVPDTSLRLRCILGDLSRLTMLCSNVTDCVASQDACAGIHNATLTLPLMYVIWPSQVLQQ